MSNAIDPQLLDRLKLILRRDLKLGADAPIPDDMNFFGSEIDLDSLDMLLVVTSVEKEFGVRIPNEAVGKTVFQSVSTLAQYIQKQGVAPRSAGAAEVSSTAPITLDRLPHREPFRFISRVISVRAGESAEGVWSLRGAEAFFAGHFPGNPLVPGVLIAEALAQLSGIAGSARDVPEVGRLSHVDIRFEQAAVPPVNIVLKSKLTRSIPPLQHFEVSAHVGDQTIARGTLVLNRS